MIINDPNIVMWANRCYKQVQKVREASVAARTNPDEHQEPESQQKRRRPPRQEDDHTGRNFDFEA